MIPSQCPCRNSFVEMYMKDAPGHLFPQSFWIRFLRILLFIVKELRSFWCMRRLYILSELGLNDWMGIKVQGYVETQASSKHIRCFNN